MGITDFLKAATASISFSSRISNPYLLNNMKVYICIVLTLGVLANALPSDKIAAPAAKVAPAAPAKVAPAVEKKAAVKPVAEKPAPKEATKPAAPAAPKPAAPKPVVPVAPVA